MTSLRKYFYRAAAWFGAMDLDEALFEAVRMDQSAGAVRALLEAGADVHTKDDVLVCRQHHPQTHVAFTCPRPALPGMVSQLPKQSEHG